jgi:hypothetical protein
LEERHDMKEMMKRLAHNLEKTDAQITDLQHRVKSLTQTSEGYHKIRRRFFKVYRRDVLNEVDRQGLKIIGEGNEAAHHGDVVVDALTLPLPANNIATRFWLVSMD